MIRFSLLALLLSASAHAQTPDALTESVAAFDRDGRPVALAEVVRAMGGADAVFFGELHDDSLGHVVQARLLRDAHAMHGASRSMVLGLEMFETDVQTILDEYEAGLIREQDFLAATRPWGNYARDYRPLVEFAIAHEIPVVGTNAPKRYVSAVSREGSLDALAALSPEARATMPPRIAPPSDSLESAFRELMSGMGAAHGGGSHGGSVPGLPSVDGMLAAQNLRDATMAWALVRAFPPNGLAIHVNGAFHSDGARGIPEHLARTAPHARVLTVSIQPADSLRPPEIIADDFVILTQR